MTGAWSSKPVLTGCARVGQHRHVSCSYGMIRKANLTACSACGCDKDAVHRELERCRACWAVLFQLHQLGLWLKGWSRCATSSKAVSVSMETLQTLQTPSDARNKEQPGQEGVQPASSDSKGDRGAACPVLHTLLDQVLRVMANSTRHTASANGDSGDVLAAWTPPPTFLTELKRAGGHFQPGEGIVWVSFFEPQVQTVPRSWERLDGFVPEADIW